MELLGKAGGSLDTSSGSTPAAVVRSAAVQAAQRRAGLQRPPPGAYLRGHTAGEGLSLLRQRLGGNLGNFYISLMVSLEVPIHKYFSRSPNYNAGDNLAEVLKLQAYTDLISKWPEIALKLQLFSTGVPETEAATILQARKLRRLEDGTEKTL